MFKVGDRYAYYGSFLHIYTAQRDLDGAGMTARALNLRRHRHKINCVFLVTRLTFLVYRHLD